MQDNCLKIKEEAMHSALNEAIQSIIKLKKAAAKEDASTTTELRDINLDFRKFKRGYKE